MDTLQKELDTNHAELNIQIIGINERGHEIGNNAITSGRDLPWLQDVDSDDDGASDVFLNSWDFVYRDVVILDTNNEVVTTYNLTDHDLENPANFSDLRDLFVAAAAATTTNPWRNPVEALDVNDDTFISPLDALLVINELNNVGAHELGTPTDEVTTYFDTSDDGFVSPLDALLVLNYLNQFNVDSAEAEAPALASLPLPAAADFASETEAEAFVVLDPHSVDDVFLSQENTRAVDLHFDLPEKNFGVLDSASSTSTESLEIEPLEEPLETF